MVEAALQRRSGVSTFRVDHAVFSGMDLLRNMIPDNPVEATFSRSRTAYSRLKQARNEEASEESDGDDSAAALLLNASSVLGDAANRTLQEISKVIQEVGVHGFGSGKLASILAPMKAYGMRNTTWQ